MRNFKRLFIESTLLTILEFQPRLKKYWKLTEKMEMAQKMSEFYQKHF